MRYMQEQGIEVVAVSAEGSEVAQVIATEGVRHEVIPFTRTISPFQDLLCLWKMIRLIRKERPSIIHTHTPKAGLIGMLAAWLTRVPMRLHTVAGMPLMESKGFTRKILVFTEWLTYACAHQVFPNSYRLEEYIHQHFSISEHKVKVIGKGSSNGIDTHYFQPNEALKETALQLSDQLGIPSGAFVWVFVGRLVGDKGIHELVTSFLAMQKINPEQHLVLVGPFEDEKDGVKAAIKQAIQDHPQIHTPGFQADVRPWLQMASAFVFPSYREGFPNVVLQAAAMSLPMIVTDINGCNEIITHEENGLIVPPKDQASLQSAMERLYQDAHLRSKFQSTVRQTILSYDRQSIWEELLGVYREVSSR